MSAAASTPESMNHSMLRPGQLYQLHYPDEGKYELIKFAGFKTLFSVQVYPMAPAQHIYPITGKKESVERQIKIYDDEKKPVPIQAVNPAIAYQVETDKFKGRARLAVTISNIVEYYKRGASGKFTNNAPRPMKFELDAGDESRVIYPLGANLGKNHFPFPKINKQTFKNNAWNRRSHLIAARNAYRGKTRKNRH